MRWTMLLVIVIPALVCWIYGRITNPSIKQEINRMADKSRRRKKKRKRSAAYCGGLANR